MCYDARMKIITWNVNGLRALHRKGVWEPFFHDESFDVLCLQETKADVTQLPELLASPKDHVAFFASSQGKKGYSGVATYAKKAPDQTEYGLGEERFDTEGRVIISYCGKIAIINVYVPNGGQGQHRLDYKFDFLDALLVKMNALRAGGFSIVLCGDINIAHEPIDLARPEANEQNTGFLPEERAWIDEIINQGYIDIFRHLNPGKEGAYTYWDQRFHARDRNVGWRIDYFFISPDLLSRVKNVTILSQVYGSDHCPVMLEL
jgi:exodeoxyribonuclease-3